MLATISGTPVHSRPECLNLNVRCSSTCRCMHTRAGACAYLVVVGVLPVTAGCVQRLVGCGPVETDLAATVWWRVRFGGVRSVGRRSGVRERGTAGAPAGTHAPEEPRGSDPEQPAPRPRRAGPQSEHASIMERRRARAGSGRYTCAAPHARAGRRFTGTCFQDVRTNLRSG